MAQSSKSCALFGVLFRCSAGFTRVFGVIRVPAKSLDITLATCADAREGIGKANPTTPLRRKPDCQVVYPPRQAISSRFHSGATIMSVKRQPAFTRRKLSAVVRKAITSYYTDQEQAEIEKAANQEKISKSSFVASAALKEARRIKR
jgi:hypothetical protein